MLREMNSATQSTWMRGEDGEWREVGDPLLNHECRVRPGELKGINQHRAVRLGECPGCGRSFRKVLDWTNRRESNWIPA